MRRVLTDEEKEWLDRSKPFAWKIKEHCPKRIEEVLNKKLELLYKNGEEK